MAKHGRPSKYSNKIADEILDRLTNGESLVKICKLKSMPNPSTVYRWIEQKESFRNKYARAREEQADTLADEIIKLSDDATAKNYNAKRLQVDARKWVASKLKPKKYGDRLDMNHEGKYEIYVNAPEVKE